MMDGRMDVWLNFLLSGLLYFFNYDGGFHSKTISKIKIHFVRET